MQEVFKELLAEIFAEKFKPLKWRKERGNFRFFGEDGLCKIINFQRSMHNTKDSMLFFINYGLYMESGDTIENKTFKAYECQFRKRTKFSDGMYWLNRRSDISKVKADVMAAIEEAMDFLDRVPTKERFVEMRRNGELQKYLYG